MDNIVVAGNKLSDCIGKYITIYHKWNFDRNSETSYNDYCVVKVLNVTLPGMLTEPTITVEFIDGSKATLMYISEFRAHLAFVWNYKTYGSKFNKFFITCIDGEWMCSYDDDKIEKTKRDFHLATGTLRVELYDTDFESNKAMAEYKEYYAETYK